MSELSDNYPTKMEIAQHVELLEADGTRVGNQVKVGSTPSLEIPAGNIAGQISIDKFGHSTNVDSGVNTDIWDRANVASNQAIWLAPTAARIHTIASTSANDTTGGTGANSVRVSYLPDWDTPEAVEVVTGDLNAGIAMNNAAVIIHRMEVIPQVTSTTINAGILTATAAVDGTVTAEINVGEGQTQMAIYGIPSMQTIFLTQLYVSVLRTNAATAFVDIRLLFNPSPNINTIVYIVKHNLGVQTTGSNPFLHPFNPFKLFAGPGILKMQALGSTNDLDVSAGFDAIVRNN